MKLPSWVIAVAILMIFFGGCGTFSDTQKLMIPQFMKMQKGMMEKVMKNNQELEGADFDSLFQKLDSMAEARDLEEPEPMENYENYAGEEELEAFEEIYGEIENALNITPAMRTVIYISIFLSILYMLSGALLFTKKPFSIYLVYSMLAISIVFGIIEYLVFQQENTIWGFTQLAGLAFSLVIDVALIIVVAASNKDYLNPAKTEDQEFLV